MASNCLGLAGKRKGKTNINTCYYLTIKAQNRLLYTIFAVLKNFSFVIKEIKRE